MTRFTDLSELMVLCVENSRVGKTQPNRHVS